MPIIQLRGDDRDPLRIEAIMNYPNEDEDFRERWVSLVAVQAGGAASTRENDIAVLLESEPFTTVEGNIQKEVRGGYLAGWIMSALYIKYRRGHKGLSITKVITEGRDWAKRERVFSDGSPIPYGERAWFEAKQRFESVAHLWAVLILNRELKICESNRQLFTEPYLTQFLGVAAELLKFGTTFSALNTSKRFQNLDEAYQIPQKFPQIIIPIAN